MSEVRRYITVTHIKAAEKILLAGLNTEEKGIHNYFHLNI